jgi:Sec-independent protein secretion pathway component TatC/DNA-binding transcriptional ArsR family regulator
MLMVMPEDTDSDFNEARAEVFEAIGHSTRIRILQALSERPLTFSELKKAVGIESSGHLEFHLRKLVHLIRTDQTGAYVLTDDGREAVRIIQSLRSEKVQAGASSEASQNSHWTRVALAIFAALLVVFTVIPANPAAALAGGPYLPFVGLFVANANAALLPSGWFLISSGGLDDPLEIYLAASITLALLIASPVIGYQFMKFLGPGLSVQKRMTFLLVALASILLAMGALFGYFVVASFGLHGMAQPPTFYVDAVSFYLTVLRAIGVSAVVFTLPVYIYVLVRFRSRK